jgi:hypothetical protein
LGWFLFVCCNPVGWFCVLFPLALLACLVLWLFPSAEGVLVVVGKVGLTLFVVGCVTGAAIAAYFDIRV